VRTTLKRGYGRTSAAGGNGRGTLPPDALSPVTLYRHEEPPPTSLLRRVGRGLSWLALGLVMLAAGLAGGFYLWLHETAAAINATSPDVIKAGPILKVPDPDKPAIALVLGYDRRAGETDRGRSDSMMLIRADPGTDTVSLLSLPRDLQVDVRCPGQNYGLNKINAAYSTCGAVGSLLTVKALTGLNPNFLITINFRGFKKVVNTLGGVWVDVDRRYFNDKGGPYGYATINLQPGYQRLTGGSALDFVRFRHTDSDLVRVARQQLFVEAMKSQFRKAFSLSLSSGINGIRVVNTIADNLEVEAGGGKKIHFETIFSWAKFIYGLPGGHFFQARINNLTGQIDLSADPSEIRSAVADFSNPNVKDVSRANDAALGRKVKQTVPKPAQTTVVVLNGNGVEGSAGNAKYLLGQRGYHMLDVPAGLLANAPAHVFHTQVYYNPKSAKAKAAAPSVAQQFAPADTERVPKPVRRLCNGAMLCVVVGQTFNNELTPAPQKPEIKHEKPNVVRNRPATESMLRQTQREVSFKLMVPATIEATSIPDPPPDPSIRTYRIDKGHKAVRLIFRTSENEYWGVEQTDWEDAPVLDEKNFNQRLNGRRYSLYYHGRHLHMVVLHANGATYWVVNTLLDSLSNETMIAIAKGLQPLNVGKKAPKT
jgi:LCP family protein required for cell wall assembly